MVIGLDYLEHTREVHVKQFLSLTDGCAQVRPIQSMTGIADQDIKLAIDLTLDSSRLGAAALIELDELTLSARIAT